MKSVLANLAEGGLSCPWESSMTCVNPLPKAKAPIQHMSCAWATEAVATTLLLLLLPQATTLREAMDVYTFRPQLEADSVGEIRWLDAGIDEDTEALEEHWSIEHGNISKFAQEMFEFGAGGRIHGLWTTWGAVTKEDRRGVCGRDDVRQHCIEWPMLNLETFSSL